MEERQSVSGAYDKLKAHEDLCGERYKNIHGRLDMLFTVLGAAAMIAVGAGGWAFSKVWDSQQQQLRALQMVAEQVDSRRALPK